MVGRNHPPNKTFQNRAAGVALLAALLMGGGRAAAQPIVTANNVRSEQVRAAVAKATAVLKQLVQEETNWLGGSARGTGLKALVVVALLNAGVDPTDPVLAAAIRSVAVSPDTETYTVALKCMVLAAADPEQYGSVLQSSAAWLSRTQLSNGMWSYGRSRGRGDNSNTQFALLGLHEAARAGAMVPQSVWEKAARHFVNTQLPDGGWTYFYVGGRSASKAYGSMTAAGLASLYICGRQLHVGGRKEFVNGAYPDCGKYQQDRVLVGGIDWITRNFSVRTNPEHHSWHHYWLYGLERTGMISGLRYFGSHDWYREGAAYLVATQRGGWWETRGQITTETVQATAFSLLFLAKGNRPVLIQKLRWNGDWNRNIHDLQNLTAFVGDKLGKPVTWQVASLEAPVGDLRQSPILFITGHAFPKFDAAEKDKLRRFVESGGTLLFEACCGSKGFRAGFEAFCRDVFASYALRKLETSHPVFRSLYEITDTYDLHGLATGCRTGVFYSPNALSCLWELQVIPEYS